MLRRARRFHPTAGRIRVGFEKKAASDLPLFHVYDIFDSGFPPTYGISRIGLISDAFRRESSACCIYPGVGYLLPFVHCEGHLASIGASHWEELPACTHRARRSPSLELWEACVMSTKKSSHHIKFSRVHNPHSSLPYLITDFKKVKQVSFAQLQILRHRAFFPCSNPQANLLFRCLPTLSVSHRLKGFFLPPALADWRIPVIETSPRRAHTVVPFIDCHDRLSTKKRKRKQNQNQKLKI